MFSLMFGMIQNIFFLFGYIQSSNLFPEPLTQEEEKIHIEKMSSGDERARNILIERILRLVAHICKKYSNTGVDQDDLISIGTIGLIKGINTYNVNKNIRLATYAARCIENEHLMYLRSIKKQGAEVFLNEPIRKDKDDNILTLQEILENDEKSIEEEIDFKFKLAEVNKKMKEILRNRERIILELRFGLNGKKPRTQNEIAKQLKISRSYVSRIENKAIGKLAKELKE